MEKYTPGYLCSSVFLARRRRKHWDAESLDLRGTMLMTTANAKLLWLLRPRVVKQHFKRTKLWRWRTDPLQPVAGRHSDQECDCKDRARGSFTVVKGQFYAHRYVSIHTHIHTCTHTYHTHVHIHITHMHILPHTHMYTYMRHTYMHMVCADLVNWVSSLIQFTILCHC